LITAKVGVPVSLSAQGSRDPDGDKITYNWFYYPEAASAISTAANPKEILGKRGEEYLNLLPKVRLEGSDSEEVTVVPQAAGVAHVILSVEDNGYPSLTSYRRVILEIDS
jgi:Cellulose-binding protein Sde0182, C-terminal domain